MATIQLVKDFIDSLGLPCYTTRNELGEVMDDAIGVVGFETEKEIILCMEYFNNIQGVSAIRELFRRSMDGQSIIILGIPEDVIPTLKGHKNLSEGLSFHIGDALYCTGIVITPPQ